METARAAGVVAAYKPGLGAEESRALAEALASGWMGSGVYTRMFESKLAHALGVPHVLAVNSGTAALHLALASLDVEGAEILTTPLTSANTNHAILYNRATPVFCDVDPITGNLDPQWAARAVTPRTKAILAVHFNGHPCDMDALSTLARERGLALVEDCGAALPFGGFYRGRPLGSLGDIACFSFSRKNFTTLDGGAVVCADAARAARLKRLRHLGFSDGSDPARERGGLLELGFPYRMNDLAAVVGLAQFQRLDSLQERLNSLENLYRQSLRDLPGLALPAVKSRMRRSPSYFPLRVPGRKAALRDFLREHGIATDDWLTPNHLYDLYEPFRRSLPVAEKLAGELVYLPFYPTLGDEEAARVVEAVSAFWRLKS